MITKFITHFTRMLLSCPIMRVVHLIFINMRRVFDNAFVI